MCGLRRLPAAGRREHRAEGLAGGLSRMGCKRQAGPVGKIRQKGSEASGMRHTGSMHVLPCASACWHRSALLRCCLPQAGLQLAQVGEREGSLLVLLLLHLSGL